MADAMRVSAFAKWQEQGALKQHDGSFLQLQEMPSFAITTEAELQRHPLTVEAHPSQAAALPSYTAFADAPLVVTNDPRATGQVVETDYNGHVPINATFALENDLFVGQMHNMFAGCPGTPSLEGKVFGRAVIQGRFKQPTPVQDMWAGQELLNRPLVPTSLQRLLFTTAAKMFGSTYKVTVEGEGDAIGYLNPLVVVAEVLHVSPPGAAPPSMQATVPEDARLLDSRLADASGQPVPSHDRRRHFDRLGGMDGLVFDTHNTFTFVVSQAIMHLPTYRLKLGGMINMDLCPVLNGQPLQLLCKNIQSDTALVSLLVWHRNLNYAPAGKPGNGLASYASSGSLASSSSLVSSVSSSYACLADSGSLFLREACSGGLDSCGSSSVASSSRNLYALSGSSSSASSSSGASDDDDDDACSEYGSCVSDFEHHSDVSSSSGDSSSCDAVCLADAVYGDGKSAAHRPQRSASATQRAKLRLAAAMARLKAGCKVAVGNCAAAPSVAM